MTEDEALKPEERQRYLDAIRSRAAALVKYVDDQQLTAVAPDVQDLILAHAVAAILRAMIGLRRGQTQAAFMSWVLREIRGTMGLCVLCGKESIAAAAGDLCADCRQQLESVDAELGGLGGFVS